VSGKKEKSFEENITRLEEIVSRLERGDVLLADSLALFEEGTKLVTACTGMLDEAEQKVVQLRKGPEGELVEVPFEEEA
jgi:exodeoxyribonuclease VII small subunit